ncbi:MAG TPA: toxin-antitoxin system HicB family antitoxin [Vicinamibacterales bacterium]
MNDTNQHRAPRQGASGRFVLRLPPGLHAALREAAREAGLSLNDYCLRRLAAPGPSLELDRLSPVIARAADIAASSLVGVIAFGSWARGQATATSDIDALVVVEPTFELTRAVYRRWDEQPLAVGGRPVESQVVRLPTSGSRITAVWAEVAIDGIVLFERGLRLSWYLAEVRRAIVAGRVARHLVHGQPYWHEVA